MNIVEKHKTANWINSINSKSETITWIPIFTIEFDNDYQRIFGLCKDGNWITQVIQNGKETISLVRNKNEYIKIITVLEKDRLEIEKSLLAGLKSNTNGTYTIDVFPFLDLIKYALEVDSEYWAKLAVSWLKQEEFDQELCTIAKTIISEKRLDQRTRHELFKLMKRFEEKKADNTK